MNGAERKRNEPYGMELILDIHDTQWLASRERIRGFMLQICEELVLEPEDLHFWDYEGDPEGYGRAAPHLKGSSAVQFIKTSNVVVHALDELKRVYVNIFACGTFDNKKAESVALRHFGGRVVQHLLITRN